MVLCKCKDCKHFRMHYVRHRNNFYLPLDYGHCVYPRLKKRPADTRACKHFSPQE